MDVKDKIAPKDREELQNLLTEYNVLANLMHQRRRMIDAKAQQVVAYLTPNPKLYQLDLDNWQLKLRTNALTMPGPGQVPKFFNS